MPYHFSVWFFILFRDSTHSSRLQYFSCHGNNTLTKPFSCAALEIIHLLPLNYFSCHGNFSCVPSPCFSNNLRTFPLSTTFVVMMIIRLFSWMIMRQKSTIVCARGPCVAMYTTGSISGSISSLCSEHTINYHVFTHTCVCVCVILTHST